MKRRNYLTPSFLPTFISKKILKAGNYLLLQRNSVNISIRFQQTSTYTSSSNRLRPPPLVSVSQWFTSRTRNSRYLTFFFIRLGKRKIKCLDEENESQNLKKEKLIGV